LQRRAGAPRTAAIVTGPLSFSSFLPLLSWLAGQRRSSQTTPIKRDHRYWLPGQRGHL
jgi:hypothetical protein